MNNPFAPKFEDLPNAIPVFPLTGVLLLPSGQLPLNIFEQRYLDMINDAMSSHRMIGMIQPKQPNHDGAQKTPDLSDIGCVGKITDYSETPDGRYLISLTGICRFKIEEELTAATQYRQVAPDWAPFKDDLNSKECLDLDRKKLTSLLGDYFDHVGLSCDWNMIDDASDGHLITCLSMICPLEPKEKQALLEAECCNSRADLFMTILDMTVRGQTGNDNPSTQH